MGPYAKKGTKVKLPTAKEPRDLETLKKELGEVFMQLGQAQYQVEVFTNDAKRLIARALALNEEGAARLRKDEASNVPA